MPRELKTLFVIAAVAALVYFTAFSGTSVDEHTEIAVAEQFGCVTISVEGCVV